MVVCTCGKPAVVKTSWTNRNPGQRFFGCPTIGSNCPFLGWLDPPMCPRSVDIIPGLLRRINAFRGVVEELEEQRSKYKKFVVCDELNVPWYGERISHLEDVLKHLKNKKEKKEKERKEKEMKEKEMKKRKKKDDAEGSSSNF
ncbi:zinc finger, GRF-type [Artemisia annua]|uniref:Zinc finger, GRF-type n=1 Tax=Artemisia annua TaxID=35608 RepID=A0A2U1P227_ARTAN|nr:zinc finger, GRF-type [Artemisia annua]